MFPLSLILRLDAIFTLARHVQLKIMPIPLFKTKCYQILVSKPFLTSSSCNKFFNTFGIKQNLQAQTDADKMNESIKYTQFRDGRLENYMREEGVGGGGRLAKYKKKTV